MTAHMTLLSCTYFTKVREVFFCFQNVCTFSMNFNSFYARLRVTATATQSEIKNAYYRLSKLYHPDKNNDCPKATVQFRNITEAYEVLSDQKAKAAYDKG